LDEPTAALDPESATEVRDLVRQLSRTEKCAILLSTHRMEDAERLCNHVMIVDRGKRIAVDTPESLREKLGPPILEVVLKANSFKISKSVRNIPTVKAFTQDGSERLLVTLDDPESATPEVVAAIVHAGGLILSVRILRPSLEDAYLKLLRDVKH